MYALFCVFTFQSMHFFVCSLFRVCNFLCMHFSVYACFVHALFSICTFCACTFQCMHVLCMHFSVYVLFVHALFSVCTFLYMHFQCYCTVATLAMNQKKCTITEDEEKVTSWHSIKKDRLWIVVAGERTNLLETLWC